MISSRKSTSCCYLLIFLMIQLTASFSVEELCARRCLYGRGGVLCNCNARHFTGKRSGLAPGYSRFIKESNRPERYPKFTEQRIFNDNTFDSESDNSLQDQEALANEDKLQGMNSFPGELWQRKTYEKALSSLNGNTDSNIAGSLADEEDDKMRIATKNNNQFHILLVQDDKTNDQVNADDDKTNDQFNADDAEGTRTEKASKVKLVMAEPYLERDQPGVSEDSTDDIRHQKDDDLVHKSVSIGQNLLELQNILRRALHGR